MLGQLEESGERQVPPTDPGARPMVAPSKVICMR